MNIDLSWENMHSNSAFIHLSSDRSSERHLFETEIFHVQMYSITMYMSTENSVFLNSTSTHLSSGGKRVCLGWWSVHLPESTQLLQEFSRTHTLADYYLHTQA